MNALEKSLRAAWEYRRPKVQTEHLQAFRWVNGAGDGIDGVSIDDFYGNYLVQIKSRDWLPRAGELEQAMCQIHPELHPGAECEIFAADNSGDGFHWLNENKKIFTVEEAECRYEIRLGDSRHPGLFLDQRDNRKRIRGHAGGKSVLNLFCHTGAFSVAALKGHAASVFSIDLSKNYLSWFQNNLKLNGFPPEQAPALAEDVFEFLRKTKKNFDVVIVDPPSFSRGKSGTFSTDKNLEQLLDLAAAALTPGGRILASINTAKLDLDSFTRRAKEALKPRGLRVLDSFPLPFDFRLSDAERDNPYLKSAWIG